MRYAPFEMIDMKFKPDYMNCRLLSPYYTRTLLADLAVGGLELHHHTIFAFPGHLEVRSEVTVASPSNSLGSDPSCRAPAP